MSSEGADAARQAGGGWPALRVDSWADTRETLHMWMQIVGKLRLAGAPMVNHWWQATLYVTPRGLTTGSVPDGTRTFSVDVDFHDHELRIDADSGARATLALEPRSVASFYAETMSALHELGIGVTITPTPNEVDPAIPFAEDEQHSSYDREAVHEWRRPSGADPICCPSSSSRRGTRSRTRCPATSPLTRAGVVAAANKFVRAGMSCTPCPRARHLIDRLVDEGLVERSRADDDARGACATLTARGRARVRKLTRTHLAGVRARFLAHVDADEQRVLGDVFQRILHDGRDVA